jgi:DNA mismatch endonuclease, patch repair protein
MDVLTPQQRRLNMSRIRGKDTKPELVLRQGLHALGLRFRLQARTLPGRPDLIFPKYRTALFVHGCFWHGHGCLLSTVPATRRAFWVKKIAETRARDSRAALALNEARWRVLTVWECALRGRRRWPLAELLTACGSFIRKEAGAFAEIAGYPDVRR